MNVLVLGAGYAGVTVARRLERLLPDDVELTVVDESDRHVLVHELHRLVRRPRMEETITIPYVDLFSRAEFVRGRVIGLDDVNGLATLEDGTERPYDLVAICLGAETAFYGLPGVEDHAIPLKRREDARDIRERFLELQSGGGGRVVVGGAGLSGIQIAGELAAMTAEQASDGSIEIVLVEQAATVAPGFPDHFSSAVRSALADEGVDVWTNATVTAVTDNEIELTDGRLEYDELVWTGGIRGPPALGDDRPSVPGTMRAGDRRFIIGDAARVIDRDGEVLPATAQAAVAEARVAARNIDRLIEHTRRRGPFEPRLESVDFTPRGWIVSVGDGAVAQIGPIVLRDRAALALKATVGVGYLTSVGAIGEAVRLARDEFVTA